MDNSLELLPISELRRNLAPLLKRIQARPIVLTERGEAVAVLVEPQQWNLLLEQLEDARDLNAIIEQEHEEEQGESDLISVDDDELSAWSKR